MEKQILMEYIDACELIRETEQDIQRARQYRVQLKGVIQTFLIKNSTSMSKERHIHMQTIQDYD